MNVNTLATISSIAQGGIALAGLIASIAIPVVIHRGQKRRETLEFIHAVRGMWMTIDATALASDDALRAADSFLDPDAATQPIAERKRVWMGLMVLNAIYMDYLAARNGFHSARALDTLRHQLRPLLRDATFFALTQSDGAYDEAFRSLCRELRAHWLAEQAPADRAAADGIADAAVVAAALPSAS